MFKNSVTKELYFDLNKTLERQNYENLKILESKEFRLGSLVKRSISCIKELNIKKIRGFYRNIIWKNRVEKKKIDILEKKPVFSKDDYFIEEKIAVYTCVFGKYDKIQEPNFKPDNIDYYIITDQEIPNNSLWKPINYDENLLRGLNNIEKNRYFKMHPEKIFTDYNYSIYVDGNIKIISDLSPYIKLIGKYGLGFHSHNQRNCPYDELTAIGVAHKANKSVIKEYEDYLKSNSFPKGYGLLECNVIVREHNNPICKKIMEEWWEQFSTYIKRDQVSIPFVLYRNEIKVSDISVLGSNVYKNYSFNICKHI